MGIIQYYNNNKNKVMSKKKLNTGNDGYGNNNIEIIKKKDYVEINKSDPHDWGRITTISISNEYIDRIIEFLKLK